MGIKQEAVKRREYSLAEAIDLCGEYFEFDPVQIIKLETGHGADGVEEFDVSFRSVWSLERIERMEALDKFIEDECDHEDVLERNTVTGEPLVHPATGEALTKNLPVTPYQIDGKDIDPDYAHRYLAAYWGDDERAKRAQAHGLTYGVVQMLLGRMGDQFNQWQSKRELRDPK